MKDGVDSVSAGIKEFESAGYVIRARRRGEAGRFLKAEEATWITLDDPAMHDAVAEKLRSEGFAILSEFARKDRAPKAREAAEEGDGSGKPKLSPERENPYLVRPHPGKPDLESPALLITHGIKPLNPINYPSPPAGSRGRRGRRRLRALQERRVP